MMRFKVTAMINARIKIHMTSTNGVVTSQALLRTES